MSARVIVTGGSGFFGGRLLRRLAGEREVEVVGTFARRPRLGLPLAQLDVTDRAATLDLIAKGRFDACVHAAASCDVAWCEAHPEEAGALNVGGTRHVAEACRAAGTRLVFISTDHVFDGRPRDAYIEADAPRPLQCYGATKLAAERFVAEVPGSLILRLPILHGLPAPGEKPSFLAQVLGALHAGAILAADDRAVRYPVLVDDAVDLVARLALRGTAGVLHYSSTEGVTKYAWARLIAEAFGLDPARLTPCWEDGRAERPMNNRLTSTRLAALGITPPRPVRRALQDLSWEARAA